MLMNDDALIKNVIIRIQWGLSPKSKWWKLWKCEDRSEDEYKLRQDHKSDGNIIKAVHKHDNVNEDEYEPE